MKISWLKKRWLRALLLGLLGLAAVVPLWLLVRTYLGDALLYLAWSLRLFYRAIPQAVIWTLFIIVAFLVALRSLRSHAIEISFGLDASPTPVEHRVKVLANWFENRQRPYYRNRLNFALTKLAIGIFALNGRVTEQETRVSLRASELGLSDNVDQYLRSGLKRWSEEIETQGRFDFLLHRNGTGPDEKFLEVLTLLEKELEIGDDYGYS